MNKNAPLISIIIPVYKVEKYIHQCVDSVLGQTYGNIEVILVDDGSPDHSGLICDEYAQKDTRVRVIHKENGGLVSARKAGAAVCAGDYVLCVDSDDYIDERLLERFAAVVSECEPDMIAYNYTRVSDTEQMVVKNHLEPGLYTGDSLGTIREVLLLNKDRHMSIIPGLALKLIRREIYITQQMKVPSTIRNGEDLAVTAPLMARCDSIYILDCSGYYYRYNEESISNTFSSERCNQLRQLTAFLAEELGDAYQANLDRYAGHYVLSLLDFAVNEADSIGEYLRWIRDLQVKDLRIRTKRAVLPNNYKSFRERFLWTLKKTGQFTLFGILVLSWNFLKYGRRKA